MLCRSLEVRWVLEDLAGVVAEDHRAGAGLVGLSAFADEEEMDRGFAESSDLEVQNNLVEEVRKAFPESRGLEERHLVVDHSRDRIEDSSFGIVVVVDVEGAVGS